MLKDEIGVKNTVRVSMYLYNTKEDVDRLVEVLKRSEDEYVVFFDVDANPSNPSVIFTAFELATNINSKNIP